MSSSMSEEIRNAIDSNPVILFMKGTPDAPACGFSARTVAILRSVGKPFAAVDILPDPRIRQELSALSNWPTIPQLFVDGELIGGCDIVSEMYQSGELLEVLGTEGEPGTEGDPTADGDPGTDREPTADGDPGTDGDPAADRDPRTAGASAAGGTTAAARQPAELAVEAPPLSIENRL